jgi:tetratricopeptide (TPR) repeat protein
MAGVGADAATAASPAGPQGNQDTPSGAPAAEVQAEDSGTAHATAQELSVPAPAANQYLVTPVVSPAIPFAPVAEKDSEPAAASETTPALTDPPVLEAAREDAPPLDLAMPDGAHGRAGGHASDGPDGGAGASSSRNGSGGASAAVVASEESSTSVPLPPPRPASGADGTPARPADGDFVDLGDWLRRTEPTRSTRMVVEDARPSGDEQADFEEMLRRFKRGVAENVDAEDYEAHYDLGVAYKEMGLVDEAIAQFQKALRGNVHRVRAYEALGQCFVEKAQYPIATALLQRATETPGTDDQQLVGVLYLLGFACEQLGRHEDSLRYYQRVFAVDIEFRDVAQRVSAMEQLTK